MRRIVSVLAMAAVAAGLSLSTATPASAEYCFGLPDQPPAYVCVSGEVPPPPEPTVTWTPTEVAYLPEVCYGLGCTEEGPVYVTTPSVSGVSVPRAVEVLVDRYTDGDYLLSVVRRYLGPCQTDICP